jgi:ABC-type bacteriocin/lantibiotic exporter with double-glycine peptidase domain
MLMPLEIHANGLLQIEQVLKPLGIEAKLTLSAADLIVDEYLATRELIHLLQTLDGLETSMVSLLDLPTQPSQPQTTAYVIFSYDGASYELKTQPQNRLTLQAYDEQVGLAETITKDAKTLQKEFDLCPELLCFQVKPASLLAADEQPSVDARFVLRQFWQHQSYVWQILSVAILLALLSLAPALGFQAFADKILPNKAQQSLYVVVVLLLLAALATSLLQCFHDMLESTLMAQYQNGLGKIVFQRLLAMQMPFFDERSTGDLTKLFDQTQEVANFLVRQLLAAVVAVISLWVVLPLLISYSVSLSFIVIGIGVLMAMSVALGLKALRQRIQVAYRLDADFQSKLIEACKGMRTIKALANEGHFSQLLQRSHSHQLYGDYNVARLTHGMGAWVNFLSQLITIAVIFFGAQAVFAQNMTIGQLIAFNMLANNLVQPLLSLVMTAQGWEHFRLAQNKLHELRPKHPKPTPLPQQALSFKGHIDFKHVWFHYPGAPHEPVLQNIHLSIRAGESIGIVGGSGSGKSTLAQLLLGFYQPTRGQITLDGHDLRTLPSQQLRARIAWVAQDSFLFNTSVLNNVHLGRLSADFQAVQTALDDAQSTEFVLQLKDGMMTPLNESAGNLSGGQRQRLALARALIRNSDLLIFDEATSALDPMTEQSLLKTIKQASVGRTTLLIAHRLHTLVHCDRIIVMQQGQIIGEGTHNHLLQTHPHYQQLWHDLLSTQSSQVEHAAQS